MDDAFNPFESDELELKGEILEGLDWLNWGFPFNVWNPDDENDEGMGEEELVLHKSEK